MTNRIATYLKTLVLTLVPMAILASCSFKEEKIDPNANLEWQKKNITSDFEALNKHVFGPKCLGCHKTGTSQNHYVDLSSYDKVMNGPVFPPLVVPGNPGQSSLYDAIRSGRMPKGESLSSHEIDMVFEWIKKGAPQFPGDPGGGGNGGNSCQEGEPGCEDICIDEFEPQCEESDEPTCEPDEPDCDD